MECDRGGERQNVQLVAERESARERERERCKDMTPPVSILWLHWNTHDSTVTLRYPPTLLHLVAAGGQAGVKGRRQEGGMKGEVQQRGRVEGQRERRNWRKLEVVEEKRRDGVVDEGRGRERNKKKGWCAENEQQMKDRGG